MAAKIYVDLPHAGWRPRLHQNGLWRYLMGGGRRAIALWHRRAGKDEVALHFAAVAAATRRGNYWHCLPEYNQGRKAIWTAINSHTGKRRIDEAFPLHWRDNTNDQEMFLRFKNGSTWQVVGSDRYDATVGASVAGIVYSEYALSNPAAWAYHRPILEENRGWAVFITTPRGHNHAKSMFDHAMQQPEWFAELLTAEDTGALSPQQLAEALAEYQALYGMDVGTAQYQQEYLCSFNAAILGAFYGGEMAAVRSQGRVKPIEPVPGMRVHRSWDLGMDDDTSIWFFQVVGAQVFVFDYYSASGVGLEHYYKVIEQKYAERKWLHGTDYVPHDAKVRELGTGRTRVETMQTLGLSPFPIPMASVEDGINAARLTLPRCVFHPRCEPGLAGLEQYRREWDEDRKCFKPSPLHDWTSNPADSFRYLALSWKPAPAHRPKPRPVDGWSIPPPNDLIRKGIRL